jgi:hypothetical protein
MVGDSGRDGQSCGRGIRGLIGARRLGRQHPRAARPRPVSSAPKPTAGTLCAVTVLGLLGFAAPLIAPPGQRKPLLVIAAFAALWIAAHELSPLKPYPNFHRYMVPAAPLLVILGAALVYELARRGMPQWSGAIAAIAILLAALPALHASYRIAGAPEEDLRRIMPSLVLQDTPDAAFDHYARFGGTAASQPRMDDPRPSRHPCS